VLLETTDAERDWTTVGVHGNIVEASWRAMVDALTYGLSRYTGAGGGTVPRA